MNVDDARMVLRELTTMQKLTPVPSVNWEKAIDAYGAARELKGHVDACVMKEWFAPGPDSGAWHDCGDGWLCDKAKRYIKEVAG